MAGRTRPSSLCTGTTSAPSAGPQLFPPRSRRCADADVRTRLLRHVEARLAHAADCYRIADTIPGALTTSALRGILPALRFVFDLDDAVCTLRDVQPLAGWPSEAMPVAQGAARLALELALHSGDAKLADHLALAIVRDATTVAWRGGARRLTEAELLESRADGWARVWAPASEAGAVRG